MPPPKCVLARDRAAVHSASATWRPSTFLTAVVIGTIASSCHDSGGGQAQEIAEAPAPTTSEEPPSLEAWDSPYVQKALSRIARHDELAMELAASTQTYQAAAADDKVLDNVDNAEVVTPDHHEGTQTYELPFLPGFGALVIQGNNGSYTHRGKNAMDFAMRVGSPICAAREGVVVASVEIHGAEGTSDKANYVRLLHADGSVAYYGHLQHGGSLVHMGDEVGAGDVIAL